jgi:hypothetical protein
MSDILTAMSLGIGITSCWGRRVALAFVCLLSIIASYGQDAPSATPALADWRRLSTADFEKVVKGLLYASKFDELDAMVAELNEKQLRSVNGVWRLPPFFNATGYPEHPNDPEGWKVLFQRLEAWDQHSHGSIFTTNALGCAHINQAWHTRTGGWAKDVTEEQWKGFEAGLALAQPILNSALEKSPKCVDVYAQLMRIGLAHSWSKEKMDGLLKQAIEIAPDYQECFQVVAYYYQERWSGEPGDAHRYLQSILTLAPAEHARETYARTAMIYADEYKAEFFREDGKGFADWPTMKSGLESLIRNYPKSTYNRNLLAAYACLAKDRATARPIYEELAATNKIYPAAWKIVGGLDAAKAWMLEAP